MLTTVTIAKSLMAEVFLVRVSVALDADSPAGQQLLKSQTVIATSRIVARRATFVKQPVAGMLAYPRLCLTVARTPPVTPPDWIGGSDRGVVVLDDNDMDLLPGEECLIRATQV